MIEPDIEFEGFGVIPELPPVPKQFVFLSLWQARNPGGLAAISAAIGRPLSLVDYGRLEKMMRASGGVPGVRIMSGWLLRPAVFVPPSQRPGVFVPPAPPPLGSYGSMAPSRVMPRIAGNPVGYMTASVPRPGVSAAVPSRPRVFGSMSRPVPRAIPRPIPIPRPGAFVPLPAPDVLPFQGADPQFPTAASDFQRRRDLIRSRLATRRGIFRDDLPDDAILPPVRTPPIRYVPPPPPPPGPDIPPFEDSDPQFPVDAGGDQLPPVDDGTGVDYDPVNSANDNTTNSVQPATFNFPGGGDDPAALDYSATGENDVAMSADGLSGIWDGFSLSNFSTAAAGAFMPFLGPLPAAYLLAHSAGKLADRYGTVPGGGLDNRVDRPGERTGVTGAIANAADIFKTADKWLMIGGVALGLGLIYYKFGKRR